MSRTISWDDQRAFLAVLEEGSLSGAARRLGLSHATVRARIEALEAALGTTLFTRSVNGLTPTDGARALREPARRMALASEQFIREAVAAPDEVAGIVRLSVPEFIGIEVIPPMLARLRDAFPAIRIELVLSNAPADLISQEVDIAVRMIAPAQGALVAKKAAAIPLGLYASVDYLDRRGMPQAPDDLAGHDLIGPDRNRSDLALAERFGGVFRRDRLVVRTDSHPAQIAAARAGLGIAVIQIPVGERDPRLRRVLPGLVIATLDTWIVAHENLRRVPRIGAVFDTLVAAFARMGAKTDR